MFISIRRLVQELSEVFHVLQPALMLELVGEPSPFGI
jgi:hypothetical protein